MRKIAVDYGSKRTGIAISDPLDITVYGLETIKNEGSDRKLLARLAEIVEEYEVKLIILGMPYNENGTFSERTELTKKFLHKLKCKFNNVIIKEQDERYTSLWAEEEMRILNVKKGKKKEIIDQLAAVNILKTYIKNNENKKEE